MTERTNRWKKCCTKSGKVLSEPTNTGGRVQAVIYREGGTGNEEGDNRCYKVWWIYRVATGDTDKQEV